MAALGSTSAATSIATTADLTAASAAILGTASGAADTLGELETRVVANELSIATAQKGQRSSARIETIDRWDVTTGVSSSNGTVNFLYFTAEQTITVASLATVTTTTAAGSPTLCRLGIYTIDGAGLHTLVARTANNTSLWNAQNTLFTEALATAGGYPASYQLVKGTRYAFALLHTGAGAVPVMRGHSLTSMSLLFGLDPVMSRIKASETDLGTSYAQAALSLSSNMHWVAGI